MSEMTDKEKAEILAAERAEQQPDGDAPQTEAPPPPPKDAKCGKTTAVQRTRPRTRQTGISALQTYLDRKRDQLAKWACERVSPEALIRFALADYARSPQLQRCTHESIYLSLIACAQVGLEPGGPRQEAFIVPYKNKGRDEAQFQLGYRGVITLAKRSGLISRVVGNIVYEGDLFEYDVGSSPFVRHVPAMLDRGDWIGAYAYATQRDGEIEVEVMPRDDCEKVIAHATSRGVSPAYREWLDQMVRKAPIHRVGKRLPLGEDFALAMALDAAQSASDLRALTGAEVETAASEQPSRQPAHRQRGTEGLRVAMRELDKDDTGVIDVGEEEGSDGA